MKGSPEAEQGGREYTLAISQRDDQSNLAGHFECRGLGAVTPGAVIEPAQQVDDGRLRKLHATDHLGLTATFT